ncbi:MAG TPA: phage tail protein [Candidatus Limnocylindria bacterium]|nr:phage tail protein [Candidatus Limnocylindria bacterium]
MSRGLLPGLASPRPLIGTLPGLYQEDELARGLTAAFDDSLAPVVSTIDNFESYLDPALTPDDFLDWLAGWVGVLLDETWPIERRRAFVAVAAQLYRNRGTAAGLAMQVRLFTAGEVEIVESGGAAWSRTPGAAAPGNSDFSLVVRVKPPKKGGVDRQRLELLVAGAKPAHVVHALEIGE